MDERGQGIFVTGASWFRFLAEHQQVNKDSRAIGYQNLSKVVDTFEPILMLRTKQSVRTQLPPRLKKRLLLPITQTQQILHEEHRQIIALISFQWQRLGFPYEEDQRRLMRPYKDAHGSQQCLPEARSLF